MSDGPALVGQIFQFTSLECVEECVGVLGVGEQEEEEGGEAGG